MSVQAWWFTPIFLELRRLMQKNLQFKASLSNIARLGGEKKKKNRAGSVAQTVEHKALLGLNHPMVGWGV
jgi:hypothetical protein